MVIARNFCVGPPTISTKDSILILLPKSGHQEDCLLKVKIIQQDLTLEILAENPLQVCQLLFFCDYRRLQCFVIDGPSFSLPDFVPSGIQEDESEDVGNFGEHNNDVDNFSECSNDVCANKNSTPW